MLNRNDLILVSELLDYVNQVADLSEEEVALMKKVEILLDES